MFPAVSVVSRAALERSAALVTSPAESGGHVARLGRGGLAGPCFRDARHQQAVGLGVEAGEVSLGDGGAVLQQRDLGQNPTLIRSGDGGPQVQCRARHFRKAQPGDPAGHLGARLSRHMGIAFQACGDPQKVRVVGVAGGLAHKP